MRVLVTGGAGFIGSHVVEAFVAAGDDVVVLDALLPSVHGNGASIEAPDGVETIRGDIRDRPTIERALRGVDVVCHQAAMVGLGKDIADLPDYVGHNDLGTAVLLAAMASAGVRSLVLASSMVVYGEGRYRCSCRRNRAGAGHAKPATLQPDASNPGALDAASHSRSSLSTKTPRSIPETSTPQRKSPRSFSRRHGRAKPPQACARCATTTCTARACLVTRPTQVWPRCSARNSPPVGRRACSKTADNSETSCTSPTSLGRTCSRAAAKRREFRAYNIASGTPCTIGEVATALASAAGGPAPITTGQYRLGDVRHIVADPSRAREELGFHAEISWPAGIQEFATQPMRATNTRGPKP